MPTMAPKVKMAKELLGGQKKLPAPAVPLQISWEPIDQDITEANQGFVIEDSKCIIFHTLPKEAHSFIQEGILYYTKLDPPQMFATK